jgi:beta-1,4-mannosyl-glycoprotein beta-1,4-N-acetylglucosaminyltransferase
MPGDEPGPRFWRAIASERMGDLDAAIVDLCGLADTYQEDYVIRCSLARCVGKSVLEATRPRFAPGGAGRIVNVVPFFNELDLLRLHLEEMAPWVHRFVITEAVQTFTGNAKSLIFEENRSLFADFEDKIVHVPIRAVPAHLTSPWSREFYQRDMAIAGASGLCGAEDYILETDVDEIIDGRALEGFEADYAILDLRLAKYFLNYCPGPGHRERSTPKATIFKAELRERYGISYGRFNLARRTHDAYLINNAGWHFTSVFDAEGISLKVKSYAHQEVGKAIYRSTPYFESLRERLKAGELDPGWERVALDDSFPQALLNNLDAFSEVIL